MIGKLTGRLVEAGASEVLVDVGGVGYEVKVPLSVVAGLPPIGENVSLFVHTHVREDAIELYGFGTRVDRELFRMMLGVSGIGPKNALAVLSHLSASDLVRAVLNEDAARLTAAPGVGKKTAERLVLELKERVRKLSYELLEPDESVPESEPRTSGFAAEDDLRLALESLGYKQSQIERVVAALKARLPQDSPIETLVKEALLELRTSK